MEKQRISADELSERLVGARKVMKKVDDGDFSKGAVNENMIKAPEGELLAAPKTVPTDAPPNPNIHKAPKQASERQIRESKLPDAIKQAMIDNPITQIGLSDTLDMNFVEKTKELMKEEGVMTEGNTSQQPAPKQSVTPPKSSDINVSDLERQLTPIIENVIRKTLDEIVDKKLNTLLAASQGQAINENLAIKVGETIFTGKLTKAKSTK